MTLDWAYIVSGLAVGLLVGLTVVGGGSLMTPLLTAVFGISPSVAVGTDLAFASITKGAGTIVHRLRNTVNWRVVGLMCLGSVPASLLTTVFLIMLDIHKAEKGSSVDLFIRYSIAVCVMLTVASLLFKKRLLAYQMARAHLQLQGRALTIATVGAAAVIGFLVTVSSIGAGAIGATVLIMLYPKLTPAEVAGTDISYAVPLTAVAAAGHAVMGTLDWSLLAALLLGSIPGISIGSYLSRSVPERLLRGVLATTLTAVAAKLVS